MSHFVFQTRDEKNNILFYVCPRCSLVIMVGEIHPEAEQEPEQEQPEQPEQPEQQEQGEQEVTEKHKKRRAKVAKNTDE